MQLIWITDPHLNHVVDHDRERWFRQIASHGRLNGIVISGDISEGDDVVFQLQAIAGRFLVPIYFVLGNHDFYGSSIARTRQHVIRACRENPLLNYLTDCGPIALAPGRFLIGEDGWGDASEGDFENSYVRLNDFHLIEDFSTAAPETWKQQLLDLGEQSANRLSAKLAELPSDATEILVVTHVPPLCESCWYEGRTTDENWSPFFVCGQIGQCLKRAATEKTNCQITVLCGHTHHAGLANVTPNLVIHTGGAAYAQPDVEAIVDLNQMPAAIRCQR